MWTYSLLFYFKAISTYCKVHGARSSVYHSNAILVAGRERSQGFLWSVNAISFKDATYTKVKCKIATQNVSRFIFQSNLWFLFECKLLRKVLRHLIVSTNLLWLSSLRQFQFAELQQRWKMFQQESVQLSYAAEEGKEYGNSEGWDITSTQTAEWGLQWEADSELLLDPVSTATHPTRITKMVISMLCLLNEKFVSYSKSFCSFCSVILKMLSNLQPQ